MAAKSKKDGTYQMLNSPIKWVGGKSRLRKPIIDLLPAHTCYVEPFAGAAWVLFGKPLSDVEVLNDIDQELVTFFRVVKEKPEELIASFEWELVSRAEFNRLAGLDPSQLTDVQRAHRFYYLIMAGWGGELNYPRFQTSITDGGHGNRLIGALKTLRERLQPIHERLRTVIIENLDWRECIDRYDRPGTVMYVDPPYPGNGANYAHNMREWEDHRELADRLNRAQCRWILSSYDIPEIRELFGKHFIISVQSASGMKVKKNDNSRVLNREVLITNYRPATQLPHGQIENYQLAFALEQPAKEHRLVYLYQSKP
ncbi:MAG TPA: DNA adenine methylase [Anaerolineae bacterium]|nr:DNA adenine methylase [Anaerolineae bacterium]